MAQQGSREWRRNPPGDLSSIGLPIRPALRGRRFGLRHLVTVVRAGPRRSDLDGALAAGANPCESPALAHRAARLTSRRNRERLALSIDRVLAKAIQPAPRLSSAIPPCRDEVVSAASLLVEVSELLRSCAPVYRRGVAMVERLLRDGGSSLYLPDHRGALRHKLDLIFPALEGQDQDEEI